MKNLFLGRFDSNFVGNLDVQTREKYLEFSKWIKSVDDCVKSVDVRQVEKSKLIPSDLLIRLYELGVFGVRISEDYEGINLLDTEFVKLLEVTTHLPDLSQLILKQSACPVDLITK